MPTDDPPPIGEVIRYHRKISGLSRIKLANLAGVGKTVIFDIEHGKASVRWDTLTKVLAVLNIRLVPESPLMDRYRAEKESS